MKNLLLIIGSIGLGYSLNTETGKKLRTWAVSKVQDQINNLVGKINEVTESVDSPSEDTPNEGK